MLGEFVPLEKPELETWSKYKKGSIKKFPENENFLKWLGCDFSYLEKGLRYNNPYELRVKALDEVLSKHEFGRVLYHLVQRRGYKDIGETNEETENQKKRREEGGFQKAIEANRTIAEALKKDFLDKGQRARNQYPYRDEYETELIHICRAQGYDITKNNNGEYINPFVGKIWKAIIWQRPLKTQKGNIGKCSLEPTKPRCPASHPVFEVFRAWSFINTIKYKDNNDEKQFLPLDFRVKLFENFFLKKNQNFKFEEIRKFLDKLFKDSKEYNYPYNIKKKIYDSTVAGMPICSGLISVFGNVIRDSISSIEHYNIGNAPKVINGYSIYDLWHILTEFDEKHLEQFAIKNLEAHNKKSKNDKEYNPFSKLKNLITTGYSDLSIKAMVKIIPFLKQGFLYNEATLLAKIPEILGENWYTNGEKIKDLLKKSNKIYDNKKTVTAIVNNLIDEYKGLEYPEIFAVNNYKYTLQQSDKVTIEHACKKHFGEISWARKNDREEILSAVAEGYQAFFCDEKRAYQNLPTLVEIFKGELSNLNIEITGSLYHHSHRANLYGKAIKDEKSGLYILPEPKINSIKNPMFNKSMSILRKLVNTLIKSGAVDEDTEVVIEIARELNDNNKRMAIERYQKEREANRKKYKEFLQEFKEKEKPSINVEEALSIFELWNEQTFEQTENEKGEKVTNRSNIDILKEKGVHFKLSRLGSSFKFGLNEFDQLVPLAVHACNPEVEHVLGAFLGPALTGQL